jgi:hypothetical protein
MIRSSHSTTYTPEEAKEPDPEPNKRTMTVTKRLELTELGVSESKTLIRTSSEQQQVGKELRGPLLAMSRFGRKRGLFLGRL